MSEAAQSSETLEAAVRAFLAAYDEPQATWADVEHLVAPMRETLSASSLRSGDRSGEDGKAAQGRDVYGVLWEAIDRMGDAVGAFTGPGSRCDQTADAVLRTLEGLRSRIDSGRKRLCEVVGWDHDHPDTTWDAVLDEAEKRNAAFESACHELRNDLENANRRLAALSSREEPGDTQRLQRFVGAVLIEARLASEDSGDVDGGALQEIAEDHGIIEGHEVTAPCGEVCTCSEFGFPMTCYRFTEPARAAIRAFRAWEDTERAAMQSTSTLPESENVE